MKYRSVFLVTLFLSLMMLSGCSVVAGIFEAGFWTAIIVVVIIVALIIFAARKLTS